MCDEMRWDEISREGKGREGKGREEKRRLWTEARKGMMEKKRKGLVC